jgi:hypothetical protein
MQLTAMFDDLPITWWTRRAVGSSLYYVSKAAVLMKLGGRTFPVTGFSCGTDLGRTLEFARFELFERLFSPSKLHLRSFPTLREHDRYPAVHWPDFSPAAIIGYHRMFSLNSSRSTHTVDATGLAYGTDLQSAAERAVMEVCERHVLAKIWYGRARISRIKWKTPPGIQVFSVALDPAIPFALAAFDDPQKSVFVCGSAISQSLKGAINRAISEAVMLHDGIIRFDCPSYQNAASARHYRSLRGRKSDERRSRFLLKIVESPLPRELHLTGTETFTRIFKRPPTARIVLLHESEQHFVVRALVPNAICPANMRTSQFTFVTDPFC